MRRTVHQVLIYLIATVWLVNGLFCKILNFVPRHEEIVAKILGQSFSRELNIAIGFSEIIMCIWVLSKFKKRINALTQIVVVATMNIMEFLLVPELLLWGKYNSLFAFIFITIIYINEYHINNDRHA